MCAYAHACVTNVVAAHTIPQHTPPYTKVKKRRKKKPHFLDRSIIKISVFLFIRRRKEILGQVLLKPRMIPDAINCNAVQRIDPQHRLDKVGSVGGDMVRDGKDTTTNLLKQVWYVVVIKGQLLDTWCVMVATLKWWVGGCAARMG